MEENQSKKKIKIVYIIIPVLVIACLVELVIILNTNNKELQSKKEEPQEKVEIKEPNYNDDLKLGDSTILYDSGNVSYDNTNSGLTSTNVKAAIDELYGAANTCVTNLGTCNSNYSLCSTNLSTCNTDKATCQSSLSTCNTNYSNCQSSLSTAQSNYSTCSSSLSICQTQLANVPRTYYEFGTPTTSSTTDYTTLNKKVFAALNGTQKSVCIIRNSKLHCFDNNNYAYEKWHIQGVYNDITCNVTSSYVDCDNSPSDSNCYAHSNGTVYCRDYSTNYACYVTGDSTVVCGK